MPLEAYNKLTKSKMCLTNAQNALSSQNARKEAFMGKQKISTAVRMLCDMRQKLEESAAEHGRTLSGEIVYRLRKSLEEEANAGKNQRA